MMSTLQFEVAKLNFQSPLHISSGKENVYDVSQEFLHSDQLKGALFVAARELYGDQIDHSFLDAFAISSAFPYHADAYFFPKPMMRMPFQIEGVSGESRQSKKLKKLQYLEKGWLEKVLANEEDQTVSPVLFSGDGSFLWNRQVHRPSIMKKEVQQRVSIPYDRINQNPTPYYIQRVYFSEHAGLFFLLQWQEGTSENLKQQIRAAFKLLGDNGVGTDRNVGNGHFEPQWDNLSLNVPEHANSMMATGLFCPKADDVNENLLAGSAYQLKERGGYIAGGQDPTYMHYRKKWVYMFTEGSVFPANDSFKGNIVNLKPTKDNNIAHPVWRDGNCIFLPIQSQ